MSAGGGAGSTSPTAPAQARIATVAALAADGTRAGGRVCSAAAGAALSAGPTITTGSTAPLDAVGESRGL